MMKMSFWALMGDFKGVAHFSQPLWSVTVTLMRSYLCLNKCVYQSVCLCVCFCFFIFCGLYHLFLSVLVLFSCYMNMCTCAYSFIYETYAFSIYLNYLTPLHSKLPNLVLVRKADGRL